MRTVNFQKPEDLNKNDFVENAILTTMQYDFDNNTPMCVAEIEDTTRDSANVHVTTEDPALSYRIAFSFRIVRAENITIIDVYSTNADNYVLTITDDVVECHHYK